MYNKRSKNFQYQIRETKTNVIVFEGTLQDFCKRFDICKTTVYSGIKNYNGTFYYGRYRLIELGELDENGQIIPVENVPAYKQPTRSSTRISKKEQLYLDLKKHLQIYRNTIAYKYAEEFQERLKEEGINVKVIHEPKRIIYKKSGSDREIWPECWIFELVKK